MYGSAGGAARAEERGGGAKFLKSNFLDCKYSQILPYMIPGYTPLFGKSLRHPLKASAAGPPMGRAAQLAT